MRARYRAAKDMALWLAARALRSADALEKRGRQHSTRRFREAAEAPRGQRPDARTETPRTGTGRSHDRLLHVEQTASGSPRAHADDERSWEVGQVRSTREAAERRRASAGRGGSGGKGPGQGELARGQRVPDSEPGRRAQRSRAGTSSCEEGQETAVHGALPPRLRRRSTPRRVLRSEARRECGHRRRDLAALRRGT